MTVVYVTRSIRQILPRLEIRARDRRSGAYGVYSKTGDRTRTGRNVRLYDDGRNINFLTSTFVSYPTTLPTGSKHLASDLTGTLGSVLGNVSREATDLFVPHFDLSEPVGAFHDEGNPAQDETNLVNSTLMTGTAFFVEQDRFKSKITHKTVVRMDFPLTTRSAFNATTSSLMYLNAGSAKFDEIREGSSIAQTWQHAPYAFNPLPFTPYGMSFCPINDRAYVADRSFIAAELYYNRLASYVGDGNNDLNFFSGLNVPSAVAFGVIPSASLVNPAHNASSAQMIPMSGVLGQPFLLEKAIVEIPIEAGPGWLNDRFGIRLPTKSITASHLDAGGPCVTVALMRQDRANKNARDLIASATFTSQLDMTTGSYFTTTSSYTDSGGSVDYVRTYEGLTAMTNVQIVVTGSTLSGSSNVFSGTLRLILEPRVMSHLWRGRLSGSNGNANLLAVPTDSSNNNKGPSRALEAQGISFSTICDRSTLELGSGRRVLGRQVAGVPLSKISGLTNPILAPDSQAENFNNRTGGVRYDGTIYTDVVSVSQPSPYLLYPQDDLVLCLSKHRAVGSATGSAWSLPVVSNTGVATPFSLMSNHDIVVPTGSVKITLYGDLIREDTEFHDTLNQRLETAELWQGLGEDPVLDQFDVSYNGELSGSMVDRFNLRTGIDYAAGSYSIPDTSALAIASNFASSPASLESFVPTSNPNATNPYWVSGSTLKHYLKRGRHVVHSSDNEIFWDCRLPNPKAMMDLYNPNFALVFYSATFGSFANVLFSSGSGPGTNFYGGLNDLFMSFPYEGKFDSIQKRFSPYLGQDLFKGQQGNSSAVYFSYMSYDQFVIQLGDGSNRAVMTGDANVFQPLGNPKHEFLKYFFGTGEGYGIQDNMHVRGKITNAVGLTGAKLRGWRYGMMSAFPLKPSAVFRRGRFGQFRDMLEQRPDGKLYDQIGLNSDGNIGTSVGVREGAVKVSFFDQYGKPTDPVRTLSCNLSTEATSSVPYTDGVLRNRAEYDRGVLNLANVVI